MLLFSIHITAGSELMGSKLEIADAIENNDLNKAYDEYCKKILSNKQILIRRVTAVLCFDVDK